MRLKLFSGVDLAKLEEDVNAWLSRQAGARVHHTQTTATVINTPQGGRTAIFVSVWYE